MNQVPIADLPMPHRDRPNLDSHEISARKAQFPPLPKKCAFQNGLEIKPQLPKLSQTSKSSACSGALSSAHRYGGAEMFGTRQTHGHMRRGISAHGVFGGLSDYGKSSAPSRDSQRNGTCACGSGVLSLGFQLIDDFLWHARERKLIFCPAAAAAAESNRSCRRR